MEEYLIPDYYPEFKCKIGDCRTPCCDGWPVSLSLDDYFALSSCNCSLDLRSKLDRSLKVKLYPTIDSYAEIAHSYTGKCPLQNDDGKCMIQLELGENSLSHVCRLYPRGVRKEPSPECSCSCSCEKVIEIFFNKKESIKFIKEKINIKEPPYIKRNYNFPTMGREQEIRFALIEKIQNPSLPFYKRILSLGMALYKLEPIIKNQDRENLDLFISNKSEVLLPQIEISINHLLHGIKIIKELLGILDERSESLKKYGESIYNYFSNSENIFEKYCISKVKFELLMPDWERFFEHLLVNHMFFSQFPFQDREETLWDEYVALCSIYALLRFLSIGFAAMKTDLIEYIDMCAAFFRLVEHTDFDRLSSRILKKIGCFTPQPLHDLLII